jgi:stage III sporulation protein AF
VNQLLDWVRQIAVFYILMTVVQQLLPGKKYRKYVRLYLGVVFILLVISPVFSLTGLTESLTAALNQVQEEIAREDLKLEVKAGNEARYQMILTEYRGLIQEKATEIAGKEGYVLQNLSVEFVEDSEAEDFGEILSMDVTLAEISEAGQEIYVAPIVVGEGETQPEEDLHPVLKKIRADLAQEYEISEDTIHIRMRG